MMRRYAADTSVSVERSKAEKIMFRLPLPRKDERRFTHTTGRGKLRHPDDQIRKWEQACRSRWRALALAIKAKLEAVSVGITTFEDEFMAHIVMPDGMTVGQHVRPRIAAAYESGQVTPLLPGPSGGTK